MVRQNADRNLVAALSYLLFFITGVVVLLVEKDDRFIRFHAMQSSLVFGGLFVLMIVLGSILRSVSFLGIISQVVNVLIWIVWLVVWIISIINAYQGKMHRWPIAGDFAEKWVR